MESWQVCMGIDDAAFDGLRRGDASAFETFVGAFEGPLFRFFYCETRDRELAEELAAETFARLVRGLGGMRGGRDRLRAFVFATARHVRSRHRRQAARRGVSLDAAREVAGPGATPPDGIERSEQNDGLMRAVGRLDAAVRAVVLLRFVEDFSIREIAQALDVPEGTVKSHLHRGKQRLKELLLQAGCEP